MTQPPCRISWPQHSPQWTTSSLNDLENSLKSFAPAIKTKEKALSRILFWRNIEESTSLNQEKYVKLEDLIEISSKFSIPFPIDSVKIEKLRETVESEVLERNANSVYPVVHETVLHLYYQFLEHKKTHGTKLEKKVYQNMTVLELVDRLLRKRAVTFLGSFDRTILLDGSVKANLWEIIGTDEETRPLVLENYISYDEIKLSAYLSVSSYTYFLNVGDRRNCAVLESDRNKVEDDGIIIGLIGPRFARRKQMDYQECIISIEQNVAENGYGEFPKPTLKGIFMNFLEEPSLTFKEYNKEKLQDKSLFTELQSGVFFNHSAYMKRLALSFDTLLIEANQRAKDVSKMAYIHVVGIGLGVWKICSVQNKLFMDTFCERINFLGKILKNVSDICFAYINEPCGNYKDGDKIPFQEHPNGGIQIHIFDRQPHEKLKGVDAGKLLVISYAWDGNALPGNEFWGGALANSGDSACASSTQVTELHNPHINRKLNGSELRIATLEGCVVPLAKYCTMIRKKLVKQ